MKIYSEETISEIPLRLSKKFTAHILSNDLEQISTLNRILYLCGFLTIYSHNYQCALTNIRLFDSDLIILDCDMCPSYCQTIFLHVQTIHPDACVIALMSYRFPDPFQEKPAVKPAHIFHKPLPDNIFYEMIQREFKSAETNQPLKPGLSTINKVNQLR